ncbi:type II toxin-antitoxin system HigB family toxin [Variovorax paradoxus]|jgi:mRNA interferase HigB|uniref:type II toxin-antitoxin system HigB family toxin n=1 Tax=Variovorax paradoxus TaxID=34073 RepID=UPI000483AA7A
MHVVANSNLIAFYQDPSYRDAEPGLRAWYEEAKNAKWTTPAVVKAQYANASIIANNRVVFNIKGNDYRLIVAIAYRMQYVFIKFIGTHAQYDQIDAATVDQFK